MSIDWDAEVLAPTMQLFGEGDPADQSTWPLYTPKDGTPFYLPDAVFDRAYAAVSVDADGAESTAVQPCLGVRRSLFLQGPPEQDDRVYIPSVALSFLVKDQQPDGHGHVKLLLQRAKVQ